MITHKPLRLLVSFTFFLTFSASYGQCDKLIQEAKKNGAKTLILAFDGLGTAEFGMGVLRRRVVKKIEKRCGKSTIASQDFYYSKRGARKALKCAQQFQKEFASTMTLHLLGHSFGAGKGVFNFIEAARELDLPVENAVTFDPRGYTYEYTAPPKGQVENFINIYQKTPLAGRPVAGADFERNVTGKSSHVGLPRKMADLALKNVIGGLSCGRP